MYNGGSKSGFTLAEILIVLGIIGIVAVLTIPILIEETNERELRSAWKKQYSALSQAYLRVVTKNGGSLSGIFPTNTGSEEFKNELKENLTYISDCSGTATYGGSGSGAASGGCWHVSNGSQYLNGTNISESPAQPGLVLKEGALLKIQITSINCLDPVGAFNRCGWIEVDVNGFRKPNTVGKDIFSFQLTPSTTVPTGSKGFYDQTITCVEDSTGQGCSSKYLYN